MSGAFSSRQRAAAAALLMVSAAVGALAAEETPASDRAAEPDPIAGAKQDFESMKAAPDASFPPKQSLSRVPLPDLSVASPTPLVRAAPKNSARETKSANWLLEAMETPASGRGVRHPSQRGQREREREPDIDTHERDPEPRVSAESRHAPDAENERGRKDIAAAVVNPLAQYLGEWMTPQDYALLAPDLAQSLAHTADSKRSAASGFESTAGGAAPGNDFSFGLLAFGQSTPAPQPPRENPFLSAFVLPEPNSALPAKQPSVFPSTPSLPVSASAPASSAVPPSASAAPVSKIPEFAKPPADEKYFKQLKRF